jgi:hypothetical protein
VWARFGDGQANAVADRGGAADPAVLHETRVFADGRHDDVGAETPNFGLTDLQTRLGETGRRSLIQKTTIGLAQAASPGFPPTVTPCPRFIRDRGGSQGRQ